MTRTTEERLEWLETTVALQDRTIDKLNLGLIEQQRIIDRLETGVEALASRLRTVNPPMEEEEGDEPLPPHYQQTGGMK